MTAKAIRGGGGGARVVRTSLLMPITARRSFNYFAKWASADKESRRKKGAKPVTSFRSPDSSLHRTLQKNTSSKSNPQQPLYRDARHRKQATSGTECAPLFLGGGEALFSSRLKLPDLEDLAAKDFRRWRGKMGYGRGRKAKICVSAAIRS